MIMRISVLTKDLIREISKTRTKFISLVCMITLGIMISVGLFLSTEVMKKTITDYMIDSNMYDINITSNMPLSDEDTKAITDMQEKPEIEISYMDKVFIDKTSISLELRSINEKFNIPKIVNGRGVENKNDIILDKRLSKKFSIGDVINIYNGKQVENTKFNIVGFVESIDYVVNSGEFNEEDFSSFAFVSKENFKSKDYAQLMIKLRDINNLEFAGSKHRELTEKYINKIQNIYEDVSHLKYKSNHSRIKDEKDRLQATKNELKILLEQDKLSVDETKVLKNKFNELETGIVKLDELSKLIRKQKYFVLSRYDAQAFYFYESAEKLSIVSYMYAGLFFFVAILVSLTTITRMVEDHRLQIGTLKAIGYDNKTIFRKFLIYGFLASSIGIIIGLILAHYAIVPQIYNSYRNTYIIPSYKISFNPVIILINLIIGYAATIVSAYILIRIILKNNVVDLLRPKAPKSGSRIFLEKISFLWNKMGFFHKVTARNIFRFKSRMWMTIIGIAGCTSMLFIGFSLKSSIKNIDDIQVNKIMNYDLVAFYDSSQDDEVKKYIEKDYRVSEFTYAYFDRTSVVGNTNKEIKNVNIIVSDNIEKIMNLYSLNGNNLVLKNNVGISTVKLAYLTDNEANSNMKINLDGTYKAYKISDIALNYIGNYIFMNTKYFEMINGEKPIYNATFIRINNKNSNVYDFIQELREKSFIFNVESTNSSKHILGEMSKSMNSVIWVMIICSIFLAIVVLYNLTNINITERSRELSTIKVLGMNTYELTNYVYREVLALTIMGQCLGIVLGIAMFKHIAWNMPSKNIFMNVDTSWYNYLISTGITLAIILIISLIIYKKLNHVNMVEALKSIE